MSYKETSEDEFKKIIENFIEDRYSSEEWNAMIKEEKDKFINGVLEL